MTIHYSSQLVGIDTYCEFCVDIGRCLFGRLKTLSDICVAAVSVLELQTNLRADYVKLYNHVYLQWNKASLA